MDLTTLAIKFEKSINNIPLNESCEYFIIILFDGKKFELILVQQIPKALIYMGIVCENYYTIWIFLFIDLFFVTLIGENYYMLRIRNPET